MLLPLLVTTLGAYLLLKLRFFFVLHPIKTLKDFLSANQSSSSRRALFLALAGTLGVGNIFGVAAGLIYGGAGTVFWLALSSVFAAVLKYSECVLSFDCLSEGGGGMHIVLGRTFLRCGNILSVVYTVACALLALFMGSAMQACAVTGAFSSLSSSNVLLPSIMFAILVFCGTVGGGDIIEKITEKVIPLTMIVYILLCFSAILANFSSVGTVFSSIFRDALNPKGAFCGVGVFLASRQFSEGFSRGILSNEAGCGTSSLAHSRSCDRAPYYAGLSGICEVVFDTSVLCVITAVAILSSVSDVASYSSPMQLVSDAVGQGGGEASRILLLVCVTAFAYSTVVCWYYYGSICASYALPHAGRYIFPPLFFAFLIFGGAIPSRSLIEITDFLLLILSLLTLSAVIRRRDRIKELTFMK